ncbi:2-hydroxychromene-2-carboxylate isomerase [uncultured Nevskia sp.]|uniref:2-hydroxychromene-2-carboxylate isomerase n=1 Tax=uncultured Nevskia sp. TaxID=228950 RepID=UPI0025E4BF17|nr:2-hydroxychromene-2-carboxylate isomerase [uncultured Nevskia sp.]
MERTPLPAVIDFYFDFMSPFAYLAHTQLPALASRYDFRIAYHAIDLPAAKRAAGNSAPPNVSIPVKLRYLVTDMQRWARRYGVPLAFPKTLNSERLNLGLYFALDRGCAEDYLRAAWLPTWGQGGDMGSEALISAVAQSMGWDAAEFLRYAASQEARERYALDNCDSQARGVFGAPTMMIGEEMWWGNDRLGFLEEHLAATKQDGGER